MTDQEINVGIAEACGWTDICEIPKKGLYGWHPTFHPKATYFYETPLPDFINNLNAMHEAECTLTVAQAEAYVNHLSELLPISSYGQNLLLFWLVNATPRRKAEAFLRTIGKWTE